MEKTLNNRYDFVFIFDVVNGNPNGDPDAGNAPRTDAETGLGIVSDVCMKRKIRNYIDLLKHDEAGYSIYVQEGAVLNERNQEAYDSLGIKNNKKEAKLNESALRQWMCEKYYDVRAFGAVMSTKSDCGRVTGPVQLCFAQSEDPIMPTSMTITRMAATDAKEDGKNQTMGNKQYIPYGLYRMNGFVSAPLANKSGFGKEDLALLWDALMNMFDNDHSAARGLMSARKLIIFKHDSELGNAPARKLFDLVNIKRLEECNVPRSFEDYKITIPAKDELPEGVSVEVRD